MADVVPEKRGEQKEEVEVVLYTCPTGGWIMGNRKPMEACIKEQIPNAKVVHKVGYPLTAVVSINGKKGKREIGPFAFFCPAMGKKNPCCSAAPTGKNAAALLAAQQKPEAEEMAR